MSEEDIFHEALARGTPEARAAYLDVACGTDAALRAAVEGLLQAHDGATGFLGRPPVALETGPAPQGGEESPGAMVGPYKLVQRLGEGGMGSVWMAQQQHPVRRLVALKLIKAGMDSRQVLARFEAERQALALMDHPNIARVLDAGTTDGGRPYFVMELVKGVPIVEFCDERRLTPRERLELFVGVCQAVQHAHQKGIIHRDLKPSNVLVALYDGRPVPKVIDFGVAKAAGQPLTERTLITGFGAIVGTLEYMSPEQAELNQLDVDTRSDVYSLGVLLYELLTGTTPLPRMRIKETALLEVLRLIREEEPAKPSTRLSSTKELSAIAASRGLEPKRLRGQVRGELDWIVMKCLEKDRSRRYETANGLAQDLQRYLRDEPVLAYPPTLAYRARKVFRRYKGAVLAAALLLLTLLLGIAGSSWQAYRAGVARRQAEANLRKAHQAVNDHFTLVSESTLFDQPALEPFRKQLLLRAREYFQGFVEEHRDDPRLRIELAATYFRIAVLTHDLTPEEDWFPAFRQCVALMEDVCRSGPPDAAALQSFHGGIYRINSANVGMNLHVRDAEATQRAFTAARRIWSELADAHPDVPGFRNDLAMIHLVIGTLHRYGDQPAEAARSYRQACDLWEGLAEAKGSPPHHTAGLAFARSNLSLMLGSVGRLAEAESASRAARDAARKLVAASPDVPAWQELLSGTIPWQLASLLEHAGRLAEAEQVYREMAAGQDALRGRYPTVPRYQKAALRAHLRLGGVLWDRGERREAAAAYRRAAAIGAALSPADPEAQNLYAWVLATSSDPEVRDARRAAGLARKVVERVPKTGFFWLTLGAAHYEAGDYADAAAALEKATQLPGGQDSRARFLLAAARARLGEKAEARRWYDDAVPRMEKRELALLELRRLRAEAERALGLRAAAK
jgi:serine/threonine protein kinase/tetratricopeptide (TPR) repeat protein